MIENETMIEATAPRSDDAVVTVENLRRYFKHPGGDIRAVDGISFTVNRHEFIAITGASGSGKTTLLYLLGALDEPTSGTISVEGVNVTALTRHQQNDYRKRRVGFVFQSFNLIPNLSLLDNVTLPMELAGVPRSVRRERAHELLEMVGLDRGRHDDRITKLSAGQQQRVAIARALANNPAVILADEPTGNLDSKTGQHIVHLLRELVEQGHATVILVTHDHSIAARADRRLEMEDGRLISG